MIRPVSGAANVYEFCTKRVKSPKNGIVVSKKQKVDSFRTIFSLDFLKAVPNFHLTFSIANENNIVPSVASTFYNELSPIFAAAKLVLPK
jgi:hypothetical protein